MSDLGTFLFEEHTPIRLLDRDGEIWFVLNDVCRALSLANPRKAAQRLNDDEKGVTTGYTLGGEQAYSVVSEAGLYSLILTSRKPEARRFKRWVTHEVLPALRRTGVYDMRPAEPLDRLLPFLHDHQLRVLHALEETADDDGFVVIGRLPRITGLSMEKIRRFLHLFEALHVIWWKTPDLVQLQRRQHSCTDPSTRDRFLSRDHVWMRDVR